MRLKAKAACGVDDASPSNIGLCSDFYVFRWVLTRQPPASTCDNGDLIRYACSSFAAIICAFLPDPGFHESATCVITMQLKFSWAGPAPCSKRLPTPPRWRCDPRIRREPGRQGSTSDASYLNLGRFNLLCSWRKTRLDGFRSCIVLAKTR